MIWMKIMILIVGTLLAGKITQRLGLSEVVGQLLAGVLLGPALLNFVHSNNLIASLAEFGVLLLMFQSGLQADLDAMKKHWRASFWIALLGMILPMIAFPIAFLWLGYQEPEAIFSGMVFAATSISITLAVLVEQGKLSSPIGAIILAAAVIDDILALVAVTVFSIFSGSGEFHWLDLMPVIVFFIGIAIQSWWSPDKLVKGTTISGEWFFYPIFFGSIGLELSLNNMASKIWIILAFSILAIASKYLGAFWGARLSHLSKDGSRAIGAGMISRGEMALVITQMGISSHLISESVAGEFIIVIIISTIAAPLIMKPLFAKID
ncbi:cation:proton antiporter [Eupransor demetentiae]|uniref:Membrane component KefB (KefB) n=1 Tax=Eupransor demetentiae TaxID=3109584 RepID=A0ABP0ETA7_9LACO|nr:Kef-type K+ transport system [Lactobacillaceae bacterium LMG 33000]